MNHVRFSPKELGLDAVSVPAGGSNFVAGRVVPWRAKWNFQTLVLHGWNSGASPNWNVRATWYDWDGQTARLANQNVTTSGWTVANWSYWLSTSTAVVHSGTVNQNPLGLFYAAPYIRWDVINFSATEAAVITLEAMLYDGVGQDFLN